MLTRNGKAILKWNRDKDVAVTLQNTGGSSVSVAFGQNTSYGARQALFSDAMTLKVGSGTSEPTIDDINLDNMIQDLSVLTSAHTAGNTPNYDQNYIYNMSITYKNSTNNPITVSEIGWMTSYDGNTYLLARNVIDPVTIEPEKTYTFSLQIG